MKKIKFIASTVAGAFLAFGAASCTDLDEKTFDRIDATIYYQNENSVKGAVASIYSSACSGFLEYFWYLNEFPADQIAWRSWNGGAWGYGNGAKDGEELLKRLERLIKGIAKTEFQGYCYTQLTDVQQEVNGLLYADRTPKVSLDKLKNIFENEQ